MLLTAWFAGFVRSPFVIDFGGDDRLDLNYVQTKEGGFFDPEKQPGASPASGYDSTYRWTGRIVSVNLPWPLDSVPLKATLQASAPRPDRLPDRPGTTLTVTGLSGNNSLNLGRYELKGLYEGNQFTFALPAHLRPHLDSFTLRFESSETYQPGKGDVRNLSALFFNLKLEPDYGAFGWRGWLASLTRPGLLALIALCGWGLAGFFSGRASWRLLCEGCAGLSLVGSLLWWPQAAEPFYTPWTLLLVALWALLWLAGQFTTAAPGVPAPFVYIATLLPIMPFAQVVAGRLDFSTLNPGSISLIVYSGALLAGLAIYLAARPRFGPVFMWAILVASAIIFVYSHWRVFELNLYRGGDFRNYYLGLLNYEENATPVYNLKEMAELPGAAVRNPPAFAVLYWPLARLAGRDVGLAVLLWRGFSELLLIPTVLLFLGLFGRNRSGLALWPLIALAVLNFGQLAESVGYAQQNNLLLFGLTLSAFYVQKKRDSWAGLSLSLPIWVKLLPAVSGAFFLLERRWRGLAGLVVGAVIANLLTVIVVGWDNLWFYFTRALWSVNEPELGISNQSVWGFAGRLGVSEVKGDFVGGFPTALTPWCYLAVLVAVGLTLFVLWRARGDDGWLGDQLKLAALTLVAIWVPPFSWLHYIVPGLIAVVALAAALSESAPRPAIIVFALAYMLLAYGGRNDFFFTEAVGVVRLGSSYRFVATFALWALSLWLLRQPRPRPAETP